MAEVDGQQKANDACGGRVSHERGRRTRGQDVPGPINCTRRSPSSLFRSSTPLFFFLLYLCILFLYRNRCFPSDRFSAIDWPDVEPKPHLSQRNKRSSHARNVYRSLFYAFNYTEIFSFPSFDLCHIVGLHFCNRCTSLTTETHESP